MRDPITRAPIETNIPMLPAKPTPGIKVKESVLVLLSFRELFAEVLSPLALSSVKTLVCSGAAG